VLWIAEDLHLLLGDNIDRTLDDAVDMRKSLVMGKVVEK
jgi:hypothetical protein